jgi:pyridoxamine 5'-phosphate oxidase
MLEDYKNKNPLEVFKAWFAEALNCGMKEPYAVHLSTVSAASKPSSRIILMKNLASADFTFFTNTQSRKGVEVLGNPWVALCMYWMPLAKQVRIEGAVHAVSDDECDEYFNTRPRISQLGAWASAQSSPLPSRDELMAQLKIYEDKFKDEAVVPRPPHWRGFRVNPEAIEFWQESDFRLHNRVLYRKTGGGWQADMLNP